MKDDKVQMKNTGGDTDIDFLNLTRKLWKSRKHLLRWAIVGMVAGLVIAFSIPKEYTTTIVLAPEIRSSRTVSGSLNALAAIAGINTGVSNSSDAVYPTLYPDIVNSVPFAVDLFNVKVTDMASEDSLTVRDYIENEISVPWWSTVLGLPGKAVGAVFSLFKDNTAQENPEPDAFQLSRKENRIVETLHNRIGVSVNTKTYIVSISVTMQDPLVSALLADTVAERLKLYITDYRTNKARKDMEYAERLTEEARQDYYEAQQRYASYMDRNQGVATRAGRTEQERLQNEAALAFNLYNTTAQQLQMAKAKVQEITPVYTVVQPATVPLRASKPSKIIIIVGCIFMAILLDASWILFGQQTIRTFKER